MQVLQFTDPHLAGSPDMRVRGVATAETLARCIAHAARRHPKPDAIVLTGDLTHDDPRGYGLLREFFAGSAAPVHWLPGNHDESVAACGALDGPPFVHDFARRYGDWLLVMLDSTVAGSHGGRLRREELARLDAALAAQPTAYALVCLHHHPVPQDSRWLDELMLDNTAEFFEVIDRHRGVRGVAWGHTHQPFEGSRGHVRLLGTPSTCMQFAQNSEEFEVDSRPPAYRWLTLGKNGDIETGVEWVDADG